MDVLESRDNLLWNLHLQTAFRDCTIATFNGTVKVHAALLSSVFPSVEKLMSNQCDYYIYSDETDIRTVEKFVELLYLGETVNVSGNEDREIEAFLMQWNISIGIKKNLCPLDETLEDLVLVDESECSVVPFIDKMGCEDFTNNLEVDSNFNIEGMSFERSQDSESSFKVPIAQKAICSRLCSYNCTENLVGRPHCQVFI